MKTILLSLLILGFASMSTDTERTERIYQYELTSIDGKNISLEQYKGDVLLIVNTASECGFTRQYAGLQKLHEQYSDQGLTLLGFPSNDFGGQEPGTDEEIAAFCEMNFGVEFQLFSRISVRGEDKHSLFHMLTSETNPDFDGEIRWNFEKFLVDRNGNLLRRFRSNIEPNSEEMITAIESALR